MGQCSWILTKIWLQGSHGHKFCVYFICITVIYNNSWVKKILCQNSQTLTPYDRQTHGSFFSHFHGKNACIEYSKTCLIRHLCNLFHCGIWCWFFCLFGVSMFLLACTDTLSITTNPFSSSACQIIDRCYCICIVVKCVKHRTCKQTWQFLSFRDHYVLCIVV